MSELIAVPTVEQINLEHRLANSKASEAVQHATNCGLMLLQVKASKQHGQWLPWLNGEINVGFYERFYLEPGDSGFILAQGKMSYAPKPPNIWIRRRGFAFEHFTEQPKLSRDSQASLDADRLVEFLADELLHGRRYTARQLDEVADTKLGMSRKRVRSALATLEISGRIEDRDLPDDERHGRRKTYLHPFQKSRPYCAAPDGAIDAKTADFPATAAPIAPSDSNAPPYREKENGALDAVSLSPDSLKRAANNGAIAAQWRIKGKPLSAGDPDAIPEPPPSKPTDLLGSPLATRIRQRVKAAGGAGIAEKELEREGKKSGPALYAKTLNALALHYRWSKNNGRWIGGSNPP